MKLATFLLTTIPTVIQLYYQRYLEEDKAKTLSELEADLNLPRIKTFDFIVVGAGTAGCVVASRLSEHYSVLLLEAGGEPPPVMQVPFFVQPLWNTDILNYKFSSVPQSHVGLSNGGIVDTVNGKLLGGSGSHNDMIHNRGSPQDYDSIAHLLNDPSWNYSSVLHYFKKSENFVGKLFTEEESRENYGHDGPIMVDTYTPEFLESWFDAGKELGFTVGDPNGFQRESFTPQARSIRKGQRSSSYNELIKPFRDSRANLTVLPYSMVHRLLIDVDDDGGGSKKVTGVAYERHGIPQIALASKEVILSAGAFSSPLLLMKSGIGPKELLQEAQIPLKQELPEVGQNLVSHPVVTLLYLRYNTTSPPPPIPPFPSEEGELLEAIQNYTSSGTGFLSRLAAGMQALVASSRANSEGQGGWPDIQILFNPDCIYFPEEFSLPMKSCFFLVASRPKSRGSVSLNATAYKEGLTDDDTKLALIDYKTYEGEGSSDVDVLLEAINFTSKIVGTATFQMYGAYLDIIPEAACAAFDSSSESYWRCHIGHTTRISNHFVGTCSMGTVVDSKFRVKGLSNLRVIDASVLPLTPNVHTNAAVLMVGEKGADEIINSWNESKKTDSGLDEPKRNSGSKILETLTLSFLVLIFAGLINRRN